MTIDATQLTETYEQPTTSDEGTSAPIPSFTIFNRTNKIALFNYLTTDSPRIRWYRTIMRVFLKYHREYRYQLTEQEICDEVQKLLGEEYTLQQCVEDLDYLKKYDNITTIYDSSRVTSIANFLARALLYQATPEAIALETFIDNQILVDTRTGSLDRSNLPFLYATLEQLSKDLQVSPLELSPERLQAIAEQWERAFSTWDKLARDAALYLSNIAKEAQQNQADIEAYHTYKNAVVNYVQSFAQALLQYSHSMRELLADWHITGKKDRLIERVSQHLYHIDPGKGKSFTEFTEHVSHQVEALETWFAAGKNTDTFRSNAGAEVRKVVSRATSLSVYMRSHLNYATHLHTLAQQFLIIKDVESAQQVFDAAFANALPVHLPASLTETPSIAGESEERDVWHEPAAVRLQLRAIGRGNRGDRRLEDPIANNRITIRILQEKHRNEDDAQQRRFLRLFSHDILDIGMISQIEPPDRTVLEEVIDTCLSNTSHAYEGRDGSVVLLLNPREKTYISLEASDGILRLPRYRLQRQKQRLA